MSASLGRVLANASVNSLNRVGYSSVKKAILEENASETAPLDEEDGAGRVDWSLWIARLASVEGLQRVEHWKDIPVCCHVGLEEVNSLN